MRAADNMKLMYDRRDRLRAEIETAKARLDEVEGLIRLLKGETASEVTPAVQRAKRGNIKQTVIDMVTEAGGTGTSVLECLSAAQAKRGVELDRGSVSSLLSRFKKDGLMTFDGTRYRLKEYSGPREVA